MGPNGFHRHFKGDLNRNQTLQINPEIRVCYDIANGNVYLDLTNTGTKDVELVINPVVYRSDAALKNHCKSRSNINTTLGTERYMAMV